MLTDVRNAEPEVHGGSRTLRFGVFEVHLDSGQMYKSGVRIKLQEQPFKVLQVLVERPGELVTREELQARIWPEDSFGDFDHAVNVAVGKLRVALGDSADNPRFIETVPRRGYRFIEKVEGAGTEPDVAGMAVGEGPAAGRLGRKGAVLAALAILGSGVLVGLGVLLGHRTARWEPPDFQRLTVRHGTIYSARFAPDGHNVIYSAAWEGAPSEVFSTDSKFSGTRNIGLPATHLLAVSSTGEMAVLQSIDLRCLTAAQGTLGQLPLTGGSPRQVTENVEGADWAPDGKTLAVVRDMVGKQRLEFPLGHVLYETNGWISHMRVSPKGDIIAFLDHPAYYDDRGVVSVVDLKGRKRVLSSGWESEEGLAWSPDGSEVWFAATVAGLERQLYAVTLSGRLRMTYRAPSGITLEDIAPDGRVLLTRDEYRAGIVGLAPGMTKERDLSWLDWSLPVDLSRDGNTLLFDEQGEEGGATYTVATRDLRGSPPVPLGEGMAGDFSPDGKWAASIVSNTQLMLLPTAAGTPKKIERADMEQYEGWVHWLPDGRRILFSGNQPGHTDRCFVQDIEGGKPRAVTPEGVSICKVSPDGRLIAGGDRAGLSAGLYAVDGSGTMLPIPGWLPGETFEWTSDPQFLYVYRWKQTSLKIYRLNIVSGERQPFRELNPADVTGFRMMRVRFSADGRGYVYEYLRFLSDLYLVRGLK